MRKLIKGIVEFRKERREAYMDTFAKLALGQKPDSLFIACSDSRMAVNVFASTDPGDLFVVRNVGNMVPHWDDPHAGSTAAAVEFAVERLKVAHIIICGHSDCGAVHGLCEGVEKQPEPHLREWLRHGEGALAALKPQGDENEVSKRNVLAQIDNLRTYPAVVEAERAGKLLLHAIWFDIRHLEVDYYDPEMGGWVPIDEAEGARILKKLGDGS
jgi:carbonic anhydrase